jgi:hypothetical protein
MTSKTVKLETHGVVALIAEPLPAGMTFPAIIRSHGKAYLSSFSLTHHFLSQGLEEVHMMKSHVGRVFDTLVILLIGPLEEGLGGGRGLCQHRGHNRVPGGQQDDQGRDCHKNDCSLVAEDPIAGHG